MSPPNLMTLFGDRYRTAFDEAYDPRNVPRDKLDPWMMTLPCQGEGITIYPHGENLLAIDVNGRPGVAKKLAALGLKLHQDGDEEKTFLFPLELFEKVAEVVQPRKRRRLSAERREAARELLGQFAFRPTSPSEKTAPEQPQDTSGGPQVLPAADEAILSSQVPPAP